MKDQLNIALEMLCGKYGVKTGAISREGALARCDGAALLPWRVERRFTELKNMIANGTLEGVSTLRSANFSSEGKLEDLIGRELDLAAWLAGSRITSVFAAGAPGVACNIIVGFENEMSAAVECAVNLPAGSAPVDRHEIIARRGVASDQVVDTQAPQSSVYAYASGGRREFTDVDAELFGMSTADIWTVRAAFAVLSNPALKEEWNRAAAEMNKWRAAAAESDRTGRAISFEELSA